MKYLILVILVIVGIAFLQREPTTYEERPFFKGTQLLLVCKRPYSDLGDCYELNVTNVADTSMTIRFPNKGEIELTDMYCTETIHDEDICQGVDNQGSIWDVLQIGSNLN